MPAILQMYLRNVDGTRTSGNAPNLFGRMMPAREPFSTSLAVKRGEEAVIREEQAGRRGKPAVKSGKQAVRRGDYS